MDQLRQMRLFVSVVEAGGFSSAGKVEGVSQSTVSKEIAALESRLGSQLLRRSPRALSVTEPGRTFYNFAVGMLADLDATEAEIRSGQSSPAGRIRVAAPAVISSRLIAPQLGEFLKRHPALTIDLEVSERYVSLVEEGVDVAIRIGELQDSSLFARQIGSLEPVVVASPDYLAAHGTPATPDALVDHACLPYLFEGASKAWLFEGAAGDSTITPPARLRTNDAESVRMAALAGLGLARGPTWMFADDIARGTLQPVLTDYRSALVPIYAVTSSRRRMPGGARAFSDFVAQIIAREPDLRVRSERKADAS